MFRRFVAIALLLFTTAVMNAQHPGTIEGVADSSVTKLNKYISAYLSSVPPVPDSLIAATDRIISFAEKKHVASYIASRIFGIFRDPEIMGLESVAVHIAGKYFLTGVLPVPEGMSQMEILLFYEFNRHSLSGMQAPELKLANVNGDSLSLRDQFSKYNILLFFDENCSVCKREIPVIRHIADSLSGEGVKVIAVYTQSSAARLRDYTNNEFSSGNSAAGWTFLMDAELKSDYQRLYNVISTPQIYLIDEEGVIQGRNLDGKSLEVLLKSLMDSEKNMLRRVENFSDNFIASTNFSDTLTVKETFRYLFERVNPESNKVMYRRTFSYLYESLLFSGENEKILASAILAEEFIIPYPMLWSEKSYSHEWIPSMVKRTRANVTGKIAANLSLFDTNGRQVMLSDSKAKYTLLYFFDPDCSICKPFSEELKSIYRKLRKKGVEIIGVNITGGPKGSKSYKRKNRIPWKILSPGVNGPGEIFAAYEAEKVPVTYLLDSERKIIARRINTITLETLIP